MKCAVCKVEILPDKQSYVLRIDLFAAPGPPQLSAAEVELDRREQFEKLMLRLEEMDAESVSEEHDKIFERHLYVLCPICRARFHGLLREVRAGKGRADKKPSPSG